MNLPAARIRVVFLVRSLPLGGAERQLLNLLTGMDKRAFEITVVTFYPEGDFLPDFRAAAGLRLITLHKKGRWDLIRFAADAWTVLRRLRPQVIHSYLTVPNVLGLALGRLVGARVVWGVRSANMDLSQYDRPTGLTYRLEHLLAPMADLIIVNSRAAYRQYRRTGVRSARLLVIPNGIDVAAFTPDPAAGRQLRHEWGVHDDELLIGLAARLDPMKGHDLFLHAAALARRTRAGLRFVCVGPGPREVRERLEVRADEMGLSDVLLWAGARTDMVRVYNALDLATLCSFAESFPNAIGEAMACGIPCVVTDVGDAAWIVGDTGIVVSRNSPEQLAASWEEMLSRSACDREALGARARDRIVREFAVNALVQKTQRALSAVVR